MFEKILESILQKYAGQYLDGIDSQNLSIGVFNGNIIIENVSIKPDFLNMLELPIELKFSSIGKLQLNIPLRKIGSSPVEIYLDGLYMIIAPKHPSQWKFKDYKGLDIKKQIIEQFTQECLNKLMEISKQQIKNDKDSGYMKRLQLKIIDNIQLTIKSIHVRYENTLSGNEQLQYSWGISLDKLEIYTCDHLDNKTYIDRTLKINKDKLMRKKLILSNLGIYWNSMENLMLSQNYQKQKIIQHMEGMIKRKTNEESRIPCDFLISISSVAELVQSEEGNFTRPEISMKIDLDNIDFTLEHLQLQQIILMAEFFNKFQLMLELEKKSKKSLTIEEQEQYQKSFYDIYIKTWQDKSYVYTEQEKQLLEESILSLEIDQLLEIIKNLSVQIFKINKMKELQDNRQKQSKGFFNDWFGKKQKDSLITEHDKSQIEKFIEDNFSQSLDYQKIKKPQDYIWFVLDFHLKGASINLKRVLETEKRKEGVEFNQIDIKGSIKKREKNMVAEISMAHMTLDMTNYAIQGNQEIKKSISFFRPNQFIQQQKNFINFCFEAYPIHQPHIDKSIALEIGSVIIEFNPLFIDMMSKFFDVKSKDTELKQATWEIVENQIDKAQANLNQAIISTSILKLDIHLGTPVIIVPFKHDGNQDNECWIVNLGDLQIKTNEKILKPQLNEEELAMDLYDINLQNIKFQYFPSIMLYNQMQNNISQIDLNPKNDHFILIQDFSIFIQISFLKEQFLLKKKFQNQSNINIQGKLNMLNLKLNTKTYQKILQINQCFELDECNISLEDLHTERKELVKNATKLGQMWIRGNNIKKWEKKYFILSNNYLYIFQNMKDLNAESYFWIKNSQITHIEEQISGIKNSFNVKNKHTDIFLACDKPESSEQWIIKIQQYAQKETQKLLIQIDNEEEQKNDKKIKTQINHFKKEISMQFQINNVNLNLYDDQDNKFLMVETRSIAMDYDGYAKGFDFKAGLGGLFVTDYLYQHKDPELKDFITSQGSDSKSDLIHILIKQRQPPHPEFNNIDMDMQVIFGVLIINYKPDSILKILHFVSNQTENKRQSIQKEKEKDIITQHDESEKREKILLKSDNILVNAFLEIKQIKLVFVNRKPPRLAICELSIQQLAIEFRAKHDQIQLEGQMGNFQLIDLTNYPDTLHKEEDWDKAKRNEMIGLLKQKGSSSLLYIKFKLYYQDSPSIEKDNITMFVELKISRIHVNYMMQPIMRLIDYAFIQIKGLILNPDLDLFKDEISSENVDVLKKKKIEIVDPMAVLKVMGRSKVMEILMNPEGMFIDVLIENPTILIKPHPNSDEYVAMDLGKIAIRNQIRLNDSRIIQNAGTGIEKTYSSAYQIRLQQMGIKLIKGEKESDMSKKFYLNIEVEMAALENEYHFVFGQNLLLDRNMKIKCYLSPVVILLTNQDYNFIMKLISHNITYEDGCDSFMLHNYEQIYEIQKGKLMKVPNIESEKNDQILTESGIHFTLDMENLSVFSAEGLDSIPFARVTLDWMRVQYIREGEFTDINVYGHKLDGSYFTKEQDLYIERGLMRKLNLYNSYTYEIMQDTLYLLQSINKKSYLKDEFIRFEFENFNLINLQIVFEMKTKNETETDMKVKVSDFMVLLEISPLIKLSKFFSLNDSVIPPPPIYKGQLIDKEILLKKKEEAKKSMMKEHSTGKNMNIQIQISNIVFCLPAGQTKDILALKGEIVIFIALYPLKSLNSIKSIIEEDQLNYEESWELNMESEYNVSMQQLEVFITNKNELQEKQEFKLMNRRELLCPIDLCFIMRQFQAIDKELNGFFPKMSIKTDIQQTIIKISAQDILLLQNSINYLLQQIPETPPYVNEQIIEEQTQRGQSIQTTIQRSASVVQVNSAFEKIIEVQFQGMQIMLINDIGDIFAHVLDFHLNEFSLCIINNPVYLKINTNLTFNMQYYNSRVSVWEPVIEPVKLSIDFIDNQILNIKRSICINLQSINSSEQEFLFINISTQFLSILMQMKYLMLNYGNQLQSQQLKEEAIQTENESPYTIINQTGYPILIRSQSDDHQELEIQSNCKINYFAGINNKKVSISKKNYQKYNETNHKISIQLQCYNIQSILDIDLDRLRIRKVILKGKNLPQTFENFLSTQVKLDLKTNKKNLYISSHIIFLNLTNQRLGFIFKNSNNLFQKQIIKPNKTIPVPFDCLDGYLFLSFEDDQEQQSVSEELGMKEIQLQRLSEIKLGDNNLLLRSEKDNTNVYKKIIYIEAPYKIKNCLPKKLLFQLLNDHKNTQVTKELQQKEVFEHYKQSQSKKIYIKILIPGFFWSSDICLFDQTQSHNKIKIKDIQGNATFISYFQNISGGKIGCREYYFYCKAYLVNESPYNLIIYSLNKEDKRHPMAIGGQQQVEPTENLVSSILIFGEEVQNCLIFADMNTPQKISKEVSTLGVGTSEVDICINNFVLTFGVQITIEEREIKQLGLSKSIKISPRFILVNNSDRDIIIKQYKVDFPGMKNKMKLQQKERKPLIWFDTKIDKRIQINYVELLNQNENNILADDISDDQFVWNWSAPLDIRTIGVQNFLVRSKVDKKVTKFFRTDTRTGDANIFVVFENVPIEQQPYRIDNQIQNEFADIYIPQIPATLNYQESAFFSWENPNEEKKLQMVIKPKRTSHMDTKIEIAPDKLNLKQQIKINSNKSKQIKNVYLKISVGIEGFTKVIKVENSFYDEQLTTLKDKINVINETTKEASNLNDLENLQDSSPSDIIKCQISINFMQIGISLIENHSDKPLNNKEILFIKLENLELAYQQRSDIEMTQLRLKYLNIDNNSNYFLSYPVLLTPQKKGIYKNMGSKNFFLNLVIQKNLSAKNITLFDNIVVELDPLSLKFEWALVKTLLNYKQGVMECLDIIQDKGQLELAVFLENIEQLQNQRYKWMYDSIPPTSAPTYIDQIIISPIEVNLTFKSDKSLTNQDDLMLLNTLFSIIGVTVLNVDDSPLKLNGIKLNNCFDTPSGIIDKIITHYEHQAMTQVLKIVGSLNFIGNPIGLFNNISTGVSDLFEKPAEGFVKGPLEGGFGIMKGATSLVTKTLQGAFNSVSKMTGAVGTGIATLCFDDKYIEERERMRNNKPKHLVQGMSQGLQQLGQGVYNGITGVFGKPIEGAQNEGIQGFLKGIGQGFTGLAVKPLTGLIDVVSKTAEGIRNTSAYFDDKPNETRERSIRAFYNTGRHFKDFQSMDGEIMYVLQLLKGGKYASSSYLTSIPIKKQQAEKSGYILILLYDVLIYLSERKKMHKWIIQNDYINNIEKKEDGIKIHFDNENKYFEKDQRETIIEIDDPRDREYTFRQLMFLINIKDEEKREI